MRRIPGNDASTYTSPAALAARTEVATATSDPLIGEVRS
jgi:hypothetical protein